MSFKSGLKKFRQRRPVVRRKTTRTEICSKCGALIEPNTVVLLDDQWTLDKPVDPVITHEACAEAGRAS